jgi:hypothetical protein
MKTTIATALATLLLAAGSSFAVDTTKLTKEDRQKMADLHTQMAECLKSDKPITECKTEMMNNCKGMTGKEGCPMMGHMWGKGKDMMMYDTGEPTTKK